MEEQIAAAQEAAPEAVVEAPKGENTEGQVETPPAEADAEEKKSEAAKRRERRRAHIAQVTAEKEEWEARARAAEAEAERLKKRAESVKGPKEDDFADPFDLAAHKASAETERRLIGRDAETADETAKAAKAQAEQKQQEAHAARVEEWLDKVAEVKTRYADWDDVATKGWEPSPVMVDLMLTSDVGPDVAYHLGQNRALAAQIAAMNPVEAARAIGRIEASLVAPKPRTETKAPDPISPVRGSAAASLKAETLSMEDYIAARKSGKLR